VGQEVYVRVENWRLRNRNTRAGCMPKIEAGDNHEGGMIIGM
jgi:hypothetical protein